MRTSRYRASARVLVDLQARVDHRGHARVLVADDVRGAPQILVEKLRKIIRRSSSQSVA